VVVEEPFLPCLRQHTGVSAGEISFDPRRLLEAHAESLQLASQLGISKTANGGRYIKVLLERAFIAGIGAITIHGTSPIIGKYFRGNAVILSFGLGA
jgi:hypothetical protein